MHATVLTLSNVELEGAYRRGARVGKNPWLHLGLVYLTHTEDTQLPRASLGSRREGKGGSAKDWAQSDTEQIIQPQLVQHSLPPDHIHREPQGFLDSFRLTLGEKARVSCSHQHPAGASFGVVPPVICRGYAHSALLVS